MRIGIKKSVILCTACIILTMMACSSKEKAEKEASSVTDTEVGDVMSENTDNVTNIQNNVSNKEKSQEIVNYINEMQNQGEILRLDFVEEYMCILLYKDDSLQLIKYDLVSDKEKRITTDIDYTLEDDNQKQNIELVLEKEFIYMKVFKFNTGIRDIHIYDNNLNKVYEELDYKEASYIDVKNKKVYEINDEDYLAVRDMESGKSTILRKLGAEYSTDKYLFVSRLYMNKDKNYVFFQGNMKRKDGQDGEWCWGYFDLKDESKDALYKGNKNIQQGESGVFVFDDTDCQTAFVESEYTDEYFYFENGINREEYHFKNNLESFGVMLDFDGNVIKCRNNGKDKEKFRLYDKTGKVLYETTAEDKSWIPYGAVCEKYNLVLGLKVIFLPGEEYPVRGKYEVVWENY